MCQWSKEKLLCISSASFFLFSSLCLYFLFFVDIPFSLITAFGSICIFNTISILLLLTIKHFEKVLRNRVRHKVQDISQCTTTTQTISPTIETTLDPGKVTIELPLYNDIVNSNNYP